MSRPIEYDRNDILSRATQLFWQHGYSQTSVREILNATGFNRHSLYENFGGKKGLFAAVLSHYKKSYLDEVIASLRHESSGIQNLRDLFNWHAKLSNQQTGCLVSNTSNEKHDIDSELHGIATNFLDELEQAIETCIQHAKEKGQISTDADQKLLARCALTLLHGFGPLSKSAEGGQDVDRVGNLFLGWLQAQAPSVNYAA